MALILSGLNRHIRTGFRADKPPMEAIALSKAIIASQTGKFIQDKDRPKPIRYYWFGSYTGNDKSGTEIKETLRYYNFEPVLYATHKGKEKGVDM